MRHQTLYPNPQYPDQLLPFSLHSATSTDPPSKKEHILLRVPYHRHIDGDGIAEHLRPATGEKLLTPRMFMHRIQSACTAQPQRIVLPEALDARILKAAADLTRRKLAHIVLLGNPESIQVQILRFTITFTLLKNTKSVQSCPWSDNIIYSRKTSFLRRNLMICAIAVCYSQAL